MVRRGGRQRIPRPPSVRAGGPPSWAHLPAGERRFNVEDVRACCESMPVPRPPGFVVAGSQPAAVLVPVFEAADQAHLILTKRPETLPSHQGEIAFPGGKALVGERLRETALREAREEIGLPPDAVEVIAELDGLATVASRFAITPFVGVLGGRPVLEPDPAEVDAVLEVPISELLADGVFREERWDLWEADRAVYFFDLPGETVWGATARIIAEFLDALVSSSREA